MKKEDLRALIVQIRNDDITLKEEFDEFVRFTGIANKNWTVINLFDTKRFNAKIAKEYDVVFFGGSSHEDELYANHKEAVSDVNELVRYCANENIPTFASCFGFELAIEALGGSLITDESNIQELNEEICLSDNAKTDKLFTSTTNCFSCISWHKYRADENKLPKNIEVLAHAKSCPVEIFKVKDSRFYAFQFHPEMDKRDVQARLARYIDLYPEQKEQLQDILNKVTETPVANKLLSDFIKYIVLAD